MTHHFICSFVLGVTAVAGAGFAQPAMADSRIDRFFDLAGRLQERDQTRMTVPVTLAQRQLTLREVSQIIAREVPGSILEAELSNQGGRPVYVVRWEPSDESQRGRLLVFVVDAESGRILSRRGG
jgi:uncharacterized membrane protein YkoI